MMAGTDSMLPTPHEGQIFDEEPRILGFASACVGILWGELLCELEDGVCWQDS